MRGGFVITGAGEAEIGFSLDRSGRFDAESDRLLSEEKGQAQAFAVIKRAVLRCGNRGCSLPVEKYE